MITAILPRWYACALGLLLGVTAGAGALVIAPGAEPAGAASAEDVRLVSHTPAGLTTTGNGGIRAGRSSADGRFVVFESYATNLVPGQVDANRFEDVFLYDRSTGTVTLVSHVHDSAVTTSSRGWSLNASISADGEYVVFESESGSLVAGQVGGGGNLFLYARATGTNTLVSHAAGSATTTANGYSSTPAISADGRYVAFMSYASNLVAGQQNVNPDRDVFLFERTTGEVTLVSHVPASVITTANGFSGIPSLSADGAYVAFLSYATNLVPGQIDTNGEGGIVGGDIFIFERATGAVSLVSHTAGSATTTANGFSCLSGTPCPEISGDGAFVAFESTATNLVAGQNDANAAKDVFLYARATGTVTLVSHTPDSPTTAANADSCCTSLSVDGSSVAFMSSATNLVSGQSDANGTYDVFVYARSTGTVSLVSHVPHSLTTTGNQRSGQPSISADGALVAFDSGATDLVAGHTDANGEYDVFLYNRATATMTLVSRSASGTGTANNYSSTPVITPDGSQVVFTSAATNLVEGQSDANFSEDLFLFQRRADPPPGADFDGDGDTDVSVFRPENGLWFVEGGVTLTWGTAGDIPVPGDYDGDGTTDIAVYRPSIGVWFVEGGAVTAWGTAGDIPVPGDYDGDGNTDIAVYRPSIGVWFVEGGAVTAWGTAGDIPVPGDYDGDGSTDIAVYRPSLGVWFVEAGAVTPFGASGDVPLPLPNAIWRFFFAPHP